MSTVGVKRLSTPAASNETTDTRRADREAIIMSGRGHYIAINQTTVVVVPRVLTRVATRLD